MYLHYLYIIISTNNDMFIVININSQKYSFLNYIIK